MTSRDAEIIEIIKTEVKPALGCTEPIAVALAVAKAVETLAQKNDLTKFPLNDLTLDVQVSGNILKNGMGVGIPGTNMIGLTIAAALGAICGNSNYGLEVLKEVDEEAVKSAKWMVANNKVKISLAKNTPKLYISAKAIKSSNVSSHCTAIIADSHEQFIHIDYCGEVLYSLPQYEDLSNCNSKKQSPEEKYNLTVKEIWDFANNVNFEDIKFILEMKTLNLALAKEGLKGNYGLMVGKSIRCHQENIFGDDYMSFAMGMTAAASDARMAGCKLPAMSNSGSGNQGITVSMPVISYALRFNIDDETLARALVLSNLISIHIKCYLGKLSALCGCVVASTGSSCGIVYLKGGNYEQMCHSIKNMVANITGIVCDGAKRGCAMKVASGVSSAIQSAILALNNISANENDGIIEKDIENTIRNLGKIGSEGMQSTDDLILNIMVNK